MKSWWHLTLLVVMLAASGTSTAQEGLRRFPLLQRGEMTQIQRDLVDAITAARAGPQMPPRQTITSPFNVWLRSPELGDLIQKVGEHVRYKSSLPLKLNELAILVTARHWTSQFEWHQHYQIALKAGLNPAVAEAISKGERPVGMQDDEAIIHDFSRELHINKGVSDELFKAAIAKFGEQGVMDLIAVNGYYVLVSMTLNVDRAPVPGGKPPLAPLKQ